MELLIFGDELLEARLPGDRRVRDVLGPLLPSWLRRGGAEVTGRHPVPDDFGLLREAVHGPLADVVVTAGSTAPRSRAAEPAPPAERRVPRSPGPVERPESCAAVARGAAVPSRVNSVPIGADCRSSCGRWEVRATWWTPTRGSSGPNPSPGRCTATR
ncbi:molybdopterin-binding protein [Streptomyces sp. NBC_00846]|uniref:molybdopterin-binding protein n=1 Tax=Streptomyces sp. NBC_00846 TaxID=2975849 RepID=UPI0038663AD5